MAPDPVLGPTANRIRVQKPSMISLALPETLPIASCDSLRMTMASSSKPCACHDYIVGTQESDAQVRVLVFTAGDPRTPTG
jgi:hypothetical protein